MLAIDPLKHAKFYEEYGLYLRDHKLNPKQQTHTLSRNKQLPVTVRTISDASLVHDMLKRHASRHNGTLINPKMYAEMITLGNIKVVIDGTVKKTQLDTLKMSGLTVVKSRRNKSKAPILSDINETVNDAAATVAVNTLKEMSNLIEKFQNPGGLRLIIFDDEYYNSMVPDYINQMLPYCDAHLVPSWDGIVDFEDNYLRMYFKRPFTLTDYNLTAPIKYNLTSYLRSIFNCTSYPDAFIKKKFGYNDFQFIRYDGLLVEMSGAYGMVQLSVNLGRRDLGLKVGDLFITQYTKLLSYSTVLNISPSGLSNGSKVLKITPHKMMTSRGDANAVIEKFLANAQSTQMRKVILVVYAEKGSGKTLFLSRCAELLSEKLGAPVGHVSSDAYGRWFHANRDVDAPSFDYNDVLKLDNDDYLSYYELEAENILVKAGIDEIVKYDLLSTRKKLQLIAEMSDVLRRQLDNSDTHSARNFYNKLATHINTPRVLILEGHINAQDAVIGRTDSTIILQTINDTSIVMRERVRGGHTQLFLRDTYYTLLPYLHTSVYPFELLRSITRWKWD
uniref:KAP NTPase domain-containing protein n=1 Tax=Operophtera brumata cypovirus 18 TaxID=352244 RepID=Q30C74_9REOV|nr:unknown [Operophtera brumata cypovirus 18]